MVEEIILFRNLILLILELFKLGRKGEFSLRGEGGELLTVFFLGDKILEVHHGWMFFLKYIRNLCQ